LLERKERLKLEKSSGARKPIAPLYFFKAYHSLIEFIKHIDKPSNKIRVLVLKFVLSIH
jgi:hypothetical protein